MHKKDINGENGTRAGQRCPTIVQGGIITEGEVRTGHWGGGKTKNLSVDTTVQQYSGIKDLPVGAERGDIAAHILKNEGGMRSQVRGVA